MQSTGSISRGKTAEKHNTRECYRDREHTPENIDFDRRGDNIVLENRSLEDVYRERFGAALDEYNAKQVEKAHPERRIPDYLAKVREDKKLQPMYEFVVQVGNKDDRPPAQMASAIYSDWLDGFRERFGDNFAVKQAIIHMDEATPHMHVEVVPCATSGRGLAVQNSMNKAVKQAGFSDYKAMLAGWDDVLTECMERHGVERVAGDRERQRGGVDIETYRRSMRAQEGIETAQERLESLRQQEAAEAAEVAELDRAIKEAELQPPAESLAESARTLYKAREAGEREEVLAAEVGGLRERISEFEGANRGARERVAELERGMPVLRARCERARARFERAEKAVADVVSKLLEVPETLSRWTLDIVRRIGVRTYDPNSLDYRMRQAREAARSYNQPRGADSPRRDWHRAFGRDDVL